MPAPLPIHPARRRFYTPVTVLTTAPGRWLDGEWKEGEPTKTIISGSFQPPSPFKLDMGISGDVGLGERQLWTTADLPFYDIASDVQCWIEREGLLWRIADRHVWDSQISQNLYVYILERYHKTEAQNDAPEP